MHFSPQQVGLMIVVGASVIGLALARMNRWRMFSGYSEIAQDVQRLTRSLGGELSRDQDDLIIKGSHQGLPVTVRFSNADDMPGVMLTAGVPASFSLLIAGVAVQASGGRTLVRTSDPVFDSRFTIRTNHPLETRMLLTPETVATLKRLCCSGGTRLSLERGELGLTEAVIPSDPAQHLLLHLKQVKELATELGEMPGSHEVKVVPFKRERHIVRRAVTAIGALAAVILLFTGGTLTGKTPTVPPRESTGILPIDERMIPNVTGWRLATIDDFDPTALNWMRGRDITPEGRMRGDFSGKDNPADVAYFLVSQSNPNMRRVVVLSEGKLTYDGMFEGLLGVVRLPKSDIDSVDWPAGRLPGGVEGDGLILLRQINDPSNDVVFFVSKGLPSFFKPLKYDNITTR